MKNLIFTIAAFLLLASAAVAQGSIEGTITDAKGNGVANVTVTLVGANGKAVATVKTDENGAYAFEEIAVGKYTVVASGTAGFKPAFRDNVAVEDEDVTTLDITLDAALQAPVPKPTVKPVTPKPADPIVPKPQPLRINVQLGQKFSVATESRASSTAEWAKRSSWY